MAVTGRLEDWSAAYGMVHGRIFGDTKGRFADGTLIRTSFVPTGTEGLKEGDVVETRNSKYLLGKQMAVTQR